MATINIAYTIEKTFTVTNLHSLASSTTAGWSSATIDNATTDKYMDALVQFMFDPANTAPANDATFYLFFWGAEDSDEMPTTGATSGNSVGTEGALTFPAITGAQSLQYVAYPYIGQDTAIKTPIYSVCSVLGLPLGCLPPYWGVAVLNYSGAALAASGNAVKWRGITHTVA